MKLSLIIFCYNEKGNIENVFNNALSFLKMFSDDFEIIIVNDGSTDGTLEICNKIEQAHPYVKLVTHPLNLGIGMALRSGYALASKEYVCAIPGDGQFDINELHEIKPFGSNIFYSFYRPQTNYSFYRKFLTWFNRLFNQHILAVYLRDVNWIKVYRKEQLDWTAPALTSSLIESEICAKLYKLNIMPIEIPSAYLSRKSGAPKGGNWKTLKKAIMDISKLWWEVTTFKRSDKEVNTNKLTKENFFQR